jgi:2-amino-4-hydroxy-6-hydroxymethyldihydropteridine diphosphokinase
MVRCFIALGGNLGDVSATFKQALAQLDAHPDVTVGHVSGIHRTAAVGERAGGEFHNAAAELETTLSALNLLNLLQQVERDFGRTRTQRWSPRPLDLDLIFYGGELISLPELTVPHPACWYRRFVLDPLAEIAADVVHPEKKVTVGELRSRLVARPLEFALAGGREPDRASLIEHLRPQFPDARIDYWAPHLVAMHGQPAVIAWLGPNNKAEHQAEFEALPLVRRLDVSAVAPAERLAFLRDVIAAALG